MKYNFMEIIIPQKGMRELNEQKDYERHFLPLEEQTRVKQNLTIFFPEKWRNFFSFNFFGGKNMSTCDSWIDADNTSNEFSSHFWNTLN